MKYTISLLCLVLSLFGSNALAAESLYSIQVNDIDGKPVTLEKYKGKVLIVVNTASKCGFTPQFASLVQLQKKYGAQGLQVLAFPSNDFKQDIGSSLDSQKFASEKYQINFPLFEKGSVSGKDKQELYKFLVAQRSDLLNDVQWNFEKFIVNRKGKVVERYRSITAPDSKDFVQLIEKLLSEKE